MQFLETFSDENILKIYLHVIAVQYTSGGILPIFPSSYWYHTPNIVFSFYYFAAIIEAAILPHPNYSFPIKLVYCNKNIKITMKSSTTCSLERNHYTISLAKISHPM